MAVSTDAGQTLRTGNANHFRGVLAVNGRLTLTPSSLHFAASRLNLQTYQQAIPLTDIASVEPRRGLALVGDGIAVVLQDATEHRFVVFGRREWIRDIMAARDAAMIPASR